MILLVFRGGLADNSGMRIGRVYDDHGQDVSTILVDRLWPRGMHKEDARVTAWCKKVAPSTELRRWYGHRPELNDEFTQRYRAELETDAGAAALQELADLVVPSCVLVTATKDPQLSHLPILAGILDDRRQGH